MTLEPPLSGACLCGATRYELTAPPLWTAHCHCRSCRKATGAGFASYLGAPEAALHWHGPPRQSHSTSPGTFWDRCGICGSPLAYRAARFPGEVHLHAATLDRAADFRAETQVHMQDHLPWTALADPPPHRMRPEDDAAPVLALIRAAFADMEGRIDPPSSMQRLTEDDIRRQARDGEVWLIGPEPRACVFFTLKPGALYIGKLATAGSARRRGLARRLIDLAARRAQDLGLPELELQSRVELVENHAAFRAMGFAQIGETRHPGFDRTTSLTFRRPAGMSNLNNRT
ncbi:GFA family protein [Gemmobacter caeruleus]|uniref:GFA family protein n=1 Tax=Gemmobacter caeruleus TaxID=2595004 RepID=UPI0011F07076